MRKLFKLKLEVNLNNEIESMNLLFNIVNILFKRFNIDLVG